MLHSFFWPSKNSLKAKVLARSQFQWLLYRKYHIGAFLLPYRLVQPRLGDELYRGDVLKSINKCRHCAFQILKQ